MKTFCASNAEASRLAERLKSFYDSTSDYGAFQSASRQISLWQHIAEAIRERRLREPGQKTRVLEVGAGRSGLAGYLSETGLRDHVHLHAQDVTTRNSDWLHEHFDAVTIGSLDQVPGDFDLVLSSYVLEHVTNPASFLEGLWQRVATSGALFLICPRYDVPFYLPRSADHWSLIRRFGFALWLTMRRAKTFITKKPAWLVHKDPAVFHLPFLRDRDAVHWVSWFDLQALWPDVQKLPIGCRGAKDALRVRLLTVSLTRRKQALLPPRHLPVV